MLIEMVAVTLAVFSQFSASPQVISPVPPASKPALVSAVPEKEILSLLGKPATPPTVIETQDQVLVQAPTDTPTPTPTLAPTATPTPSPTHTPTPTPSPTAPPTPTSQPAVAAPSDIDSLFNQYADQYHVDANVLRRIAKCESSFNNDATNGDYVGMFQFAASSWAAARGRMGLDPNPDLRKNAEEAIKTAAYMLSTGGQSAWPHC